MKRYLLVLLSAMVLVSISVSCQAKGWLIYSKPEFRGKVIDAETKKPIEGAVVVALYKKIAIRSPIESGSQIKKVRETLTLKDGTFYFPSYKSITDPLSYDFWVGFIIYKPGYGNFPKHHTVPSGGLLGDEHEIFFGEKSGSQGVMRLWVKKQDGDRELKKVNLIYGLVELPRAWTRQEMLNAHPGGVTGYSSKELPLLDKAGKEGDKLLRKAK